jgi:hypothetical protein
MNREEAERERNRRAAEQGDSTWILHDVGGEWEVVRIGMKPATKPDGTSSESKPRPPIADDPRSVQSQLLPPYGAA